MRLRTPLIATALLVPRLALAQTVNIPNDFYGDHLVYNGSARLANVVSYLQLTDGGAFEAGSAFHPDPLDVSGFTTDFSFLLANAQADGFAFVIADAGPQQLGTFGGNLGFLGAQGAAFGIGFGLSGSNDNTISAYYNNTFQGTRIGTPLNLASSGIDLHSGHRMSVHITFDGHALVLTLIDMQSARSATMSYLVGTGPSDLHAPLLSGHPAWVGFSGGTGANTADQQITSWTFASGKPVTVVAPAFSPLSGQFFTTPALITLSDVTPGATIHYTVDGSAPSPTSPVYTVPINVHMATNINAIAVLNGASSPVVTAFYSVGPPFDDSTGFLPGSVILNGAASLERSGDIALASSEPFVSGSIWYPVPLPTTNWTTDFDMLVGGDGLVFVVQQTGPHALGYFGGELGFGGIGRNSFGVKFDSWDNAGEGYSSTGLYLGGASPTTPSIPLLSPGPSFSRPDTIRVHMVDAGGFLIVTITDPTTGQPAIQTYPAPKFSNSDPAYFGFTSGTGVALGSSVLLRWALQETSNPAYILPPVISPASGTFSAPVKASLSVIDPNHSGTFFYTLDGSDPGELSPTIKAGQTIPITENTTLKAIAIGAGPGNLSSIASATYTITH